MSFVGRGEWLDDNECDLLQLCKLVMGFMKRQEWSDDNECNLLQFFKVHCLNEGVFLETEFLISYYLVFP